MFMCGVRGWVAGGGVYMLKIIKAQINKLRLSILIFNPILKLNLSHYIFILKLKYSRCHLDLEIQGNS